tara:strand:- start:24 stop:389 length:366 start_codon:yes stop_codon:yes gene_type:complete
MLDKEQINKNKEEAIQKLCILMMICDRDIHDKEYEKVIDVIEKHSMYEISFDQISDLVSEVAFEREQKGLEKLSIELASKIKSKKFQEITMSYLKDIMERDGQIHDQEVKYLDYIKDYWAQ